MLQLMPGTSVCMALVIGSPDYRRGLVAAMILVSVVGAAAAIVTASLT